MIIFNRKLLSSKKENEVWNSRIHSAHAVHHNWRRGCTVHLLPWLYFHPTSPASVVDIRGFIQLLFKSLLLPPEPAVYPPTVVKRQEGPQSPSPFSSLRTLNGLLKAGLKLPAMFGLGTLCCYTHSLSALLLIDLHHGDREGVYMF